MKSGLKGLSRHSRRKRNLPPAFIDPNRSGFVEPVKAVAAPVPLFRRSNQPPFHRIAVHVAQLLDALPGGPDIEVVETCLPEGQARRFLEQMLLARVRAPLFRQETCAVRCFKTCMTVEGVPSSGSVMSKGKGSGMTRYPKTTKR